MQEICQNLYLGMKVDAECKKIKEDQNEVNYVILHSLHKIK